MAKQTITKIIDDIDGGEAAETIHFALDGVTYSIDVSDENASELRSVLDKFIQAGTRTGRISGSSGPQLTRYKQTPHVPTMQRRADNTLIRQWAAQNGHDVAERGRIPTEVIDAYNASTVVREVKAASGAKKVSFSR